MYKQAIMHKLDNILNNTNINDEDRVWIEAFVAKGLDDAMELDKLRWERDNKL